MKPVPLLREPPDDDLGIAPGTAGHLIAYPLRLRGQVRLLHRVPELPHFMPHLVAMPVR